ncbi:L,D-transpeptidase family protein [Spirosoma fluviale]|uniref:L,D-transpeptidase catalytic domain n=1 Tax=Spirosoma fluviale TaxID=1597977 RepID=A0A286GCZ1_9BACT|nr:L,D-transpeptidase family protein [Spirosoma fluviale]SOD93405.1 L,D-transpeptidase catalytic domain [Spirosoma fluviale]
MSRFLSILLLLSFTVCSVKAQPAADWSRLRQYAASIGVDSLCNTPDPACLKRYFKEIIYGRVPRHMGYQGVTESMDTLRLNRLTRLFLAGDDWCPLLDSLESPDRSYRQLKEYCMRCLIDDYMADSLTLGQVQETLNTYRWINRFRTSKRIVVNIPSAMLRVIDRQGKTLLTSRVVVGKADTPTPLFTAFIPSLVMYPYWNVPRSIMAREMLPRIQKNPTLVLTFLNLEVIDTKGQVVDPKTVNWSVPASAIYNGSFPYRLRQLTGCANALGILKFNVNSPYDVYLHDTNARHAFASENRQLSHGCIRVEKPAELANLLLGYTRFKADYLTSCPKNARPKTVSLPASVPVITTYNVLDIDEAGAIQVYPNVYRKWHPVL